MNVPLILGFFTTLAGITVFDTVRVIKKLSDEEKNKYRT
jgi:hypothetical protein